MCWVAQALGVERTHYQQNNAVVQLVDATSVRHTPLLLAEYLDCAQISVLRCFLGQGFTI